MHPSLCLSFTIDICTIPYQCGCYWVAAIQHPFHILRVPTKDIFTNTWGLHDQGWKVEWHVMWNILRPGPVTALGGVVSTEAFHCTTNWMQHKKKLANHIFSGIQELPLGDLSSQCNVLSMQMASWPLHHHHLLTLQLRFENRLETIRLPMVNFWFHVFWWDMCSLVKMKMSCSSHDVTWQSAFTDPAINPAATGQNIPLLRNI